MTPPPPAAKRTEKPRTDAAAFAIACGMAYLAGATDVCGYIRLRDIFVSFMSGNTTILAYALGGGDLGRAGTAAGVIGLFVAGATLGAVIAVLAGRRHAGAVSLAVALMLCVPLAWPGAAVAALALAMGMLNGAMHRAGATAVSLTYVTGTLVKVAQGLGELLCGRARDLSWLPQGLLWIALLAGALSSRLALGTFGTGLLWPLPGIALLLAAATALRPDPR